jgi:hypothetical protein
MLGFGDSRLTPTCMEANFEIGSRTCLKNSFKEGLINSVFVMPAKAGIQLIYDFPGFRLAGLRPLAGMTN